MNETKTKLTIKSKKNFDSRFIIKLDTSRLNLQKECENTKMTVKQKLVN